MRHLISAAALGLASACAEPVDTGEPELRDIYVLSEDAGYPEGIAFQPDLRAFVIGSLEHGGVTRVDVDGTETRLFDPETGWMSLGARLRERTGEVLMCAVYAASTDDARSELWVIDAAGGDVERIPLAGAPSNCNDVVAVEEYAYLTDREAGAIHRVDLTTGEAEIWLSHAELEPGLIGNNGIVSTGSALITGQYSPPRLLWIPLDDPGSIREIALEGDAIGDLPDGADGMTWLDGELLIAANQRIARVSGRDGWEFAEVVAAEAEVAIAAVTVAEQQPYGLKGEVAAFVLGTEPELPFAIRAVEAP